jgi:hypothetical protein
MTGTTGTDEGLVEGQQPGQSGQVGQVVDASQQEHADNRAAYVSRDELNQALEDVRRQVQGLVDKNVSRVDRRIADANRRIEEYVKLGQSAGVQVTPEQLERMKDKVIREAFTASESDGDGNQEAQHGPQQQQINPIMQVAIKRLEKAGLNPEEVEKHPDFHVVDRKTEDPDEFLSSINEFIEAAKKRQEAGGSAAAVPGEVARGGSTGGHLADKYIEEIMAARGQGAHVGKEIRERYRKMGVDVDSVAFRLR